METGVIYCGDNIAVLPQYVPDASVDLVYIDPPFNTSRRYETFWGEAQEKRAFEDRFGDVMTYLDWMRPRLRELHRVLKPTGSFYYHCDWHAAHYVKVELDRLFGFENFQNEIVWKRNSAHSDARQGSRHYGRTHDTILFYTKSGDYTWRELYQPYDPEYVETFYANVEPETGRHFQYGDLTGPGGAAKGNPRYELMGVTRFWRYSKERMDELVGQGRIAFRPNGKVPRLKRYLDEAAGMPLQSVWTDIRPLINFGKEALGYPTQKPLALLERIVRASSEEGQTVLDGFCGCGTTLEAAAKLNRRWIGIDVSPTACRVMGERLETRLGLRPGRDFATHDMPRSAEELRRMPHFEFQNWAVIALGGVPNRVRSGDFGIDGRLYVADVEKVRTPGRDLFGDIDGWYPIQVKQKDHSGRPDIDAFETAMRRDKRLRGYFVAFGFTRDAHQEIRRAQQHDGLEIVPITVPELLAYERQVVSV